MIFIETSQFTRLVYTYLTEESYRAFQTHLLLHPDIGQIIPKSGGVRKVRWAAKGKGKSGGVRVIYVWKTNDNEIWLLTIYGKNQVENIPAHILKQIAKEIQNE